MEAALSFEELLIKARAIPLERYECPLCRLNFASRMECAEHLEAEHPRIKEHRPLFCEVARENFRKIDCLEFIAEFLGKYLQSIAA